MIICSRLMKEYLSGEFTDERSTYSNETSETWSDEWSDETGETRSESHGRTSETREKSYEDDSKELQGDACFLS